MWLLDTSFLVEYESEVTGRCRASARLGEFAEGFDDTRLAGAFLSHFRILNLSHLIAFRMASMQSSLPQRLGENDAWIAATALYYGCKLVGREKAFSRVPNLKYVEF